MKPVIIESPYAGDVERNKAYARECMKDSLLRGEAPFASHMFYTQVLDDDIPEERMMGIRAGYAWGDRADLVAVYIDLGVSRGIREAIHHWKDLGKEVEYRNIPNLHLTYTATAPEDDRPWYRKINWRDLFGF